MKIEKSVQDKVIIELSEKELGTIHEALGFTTTFAHEHARERREEFRLLTMEVERFIMPNEFNKASIKS